MTSLLWISHIKFCQYYRICAFATSVVYLSWPHLHQGHTSHGTSLSYQQWPGDLLYSKLAFNLHSDDPDNGTWQDFLYLHAAGSKITRITIRDKSACIANHHLNSDHINVLMLHMCKESNNVVHKYCVLAHDIQSLDVRCKLSNYWYGISKKRQKSLGLNIILFIGQKDWA